MNPVFELIPTLGMANVSPRFVAGVGAAVACGLLVLMWAYRRRAFIFLWAAGWACASAALFSASDDAPGDAASVIRLALRGSAAVASAELFLAGILCHGRAASWPTWLAILGVTFAAYGVMSGLAMSNAMFAVTFLAMSGVLAASAWQVGRIAHRRRMVGAAVMAATFWVVVACNAATVVAAASDAVNIGLARAVLVANAVSYVLAAFGQHLFVFEDMMLELKDSNRELNAVRAELQVNALTDALTGLYNRRLFNEVVAHQLDHHRRYKLPLSLLYIDVDHFKTVNDTLGHDAGDRVLQHVATYISRQVREADYVFRLGGDEFLVLISCGHDEAARKARELQTDFAATLAPAGFSAALGLSIGVAEVPSETRDILPAIHEADARMYEDKRRRTAPTLGRMTG